MEDFDASLDRVEKPVNSISRLIKILGERTDATFLESIDYAMLYGSLALAACSIYHVKGISVQNHSISEELVRVKRSLKKLTQARLGDSKTLVESSRPRIDNIVAERIVRFYTETPNTEVTDSELNVTRQTQKKKKRNHRDISVISLSSDSSFTDDDKKKEDSLSQKSNSNTHIVTKDIDNDSNNDDYKNVTLEKKKKKKKKGKKTNKLK